MGYEIFVALVFFVAFPVVMAGFVAFWVMTNRERSSLEDRWQAFADRRGREYVAARGDWPNRTSPYVEWADEGVRFRLATIGKEGSARTRLVAWPESTLLGTFVVAPRQSSRHRVRAGAEPDLGDRFFANAYGVSSRPQSIARRVLGDAARRALLAFRQADDVVLTYRRGRLVLEWPGREWSEARIDEAEHVLLELTRSVNAAFYHLQAA